MNKTLLCVTLISFYSCLVFSEDDYNRAGAIICTKVGETVKIFMGSEKYSEKKTERNGWQNFVGRPDGKDSGDPKKTAAREAYEESKCHIKKAVIEKQIERGLNLKEFVQYNLFVVYIPQLLLPPINETPEECNNPEKETFALMPLNDIVGAIKNGIAIGEPELEIAKIALSDFPEEVQTSLRKNCRNDNGTSNATQQLKTDSLISDMSHAPDGQYFTAQISDY